MKLTLEVNNINYDSAIEQSIPLLKDMKLALEVNGINYDFIIEQAIPLLKEKAKADKSILLKLISGILSMPGDVPKKILNALSQKKKDELAEYLINSNKEKIIELLQGTLAEKGFALQIKNFDMIK